MIINTAYSLYAIIPIRVINALPFGDLVSLLDSRERRAISIGNAEEIVHQAIALRKHIANKQDKWKTT